MPHRESVSEPTPETNADASKVVKPSKMSRIKSAALTAGIFVIPTVVTAGASIVAYQTCKMNFDAAKLNLEAAKLANAAAAAAAPKS